jgi:hypothetical protein
MSINKIVFLNQPPMSEFTKSYEGQPYYLVPEGHCYLRSHFENKHRYAQLNLLSQQMFTRPEVIEQSAFTRDLHCRVKNVLAAEDCEKIIQQAQASVDTLYEPEFINQLLPKVLTEEIDRKICSHFGSEYTLLWYVYGETKADVADRAVSSYWHCDGGPQKHLKVLVYLNGYQQHLGNTLFLDKTTTTKLKQVGYIFNDIQKRAEDIGPLCREHDINCDETIYEDIQAGDALLFNPNMIAHRGKIPELASRHALALCFIPSPVSWKQAKDVLPIRVGSVEFEGSAATLLDYAAENGEKDQRLIDIPSAGAIGSEQYLKLLLHTIYCNNSSFADLMFSRLIALDPALEQLKTVDDLLETLKTSARDNIDWAGELGINDVDNLLQLATFENELKNSHQHCATNNSVNPAIQKFPIANSETLFGSAGCRFAQRIGTALQQANFHYVKTQSNTDDTANDEQAVFCANYGYLNNSAAIHLLARRSFEIVKTQNLLFKLENGQWADPYRESITFKSQQAYLAEAELHLWATREALEQVEVFVITLAQNECWQFIDGSVMSKQPHPEILPLVRRKTLSVTDNIANIQAFCDIVSRYNPNFKLIISLSPDATIALQDQATFRVSAKALAQSNENIYYFPMAELLGDDLKKAGPEDNKTSNRKIVELFKTIFMQ